TFLRIVMVAPGGGGGPAFALRTPSTVSVPRTASPPAARPERRRKLRRSMPPFAGCARAAARLPRRASRSVRLINIGVSPSRARIAVDAIEGLHFRRIRLIAGLALLAVALAVGRCGDHRRGGAGDRCGATEGENA